MFHGMDKESIQQEAFQHLNEAYLARKRDNKKQWHYHMLLCAKARHKLLHTNWTKRYPEDDYYCEDEDDQQGFWYRELNHDFVEFVQEACDYLPTDIQVPEDVAECLHETGSVHSDYIYTGYLPNKVI